ncbi:MAG: DNA polymerase III subunit chi, partial [Francisellaceae bacterium]
MSVMFYILSSKDKKAYEDFIIDLIQRQYDAGKCMVICAEKDLCLHLDERLWFEGKAVFLPHANIDEMKDQQYTRLPVV